MPKTKTTKRSKAPKETKAKACSKKESCLQKGCRERATTKGYCRIHYIANWKRIRLNRQMKAERRLNSYVNRLVKKYPKEYLEKIKEGLESEEKFVESLHEMDIQGETGPTDTEREYLERLSRNFKLGNE